MGPKEAGRRGLFNLPAACRPPAEVLDNMKQNNAKVEGAQVQGDTLFISILRFLKEGPMEKALLASTHNVKINTGSFNKAFTRLLTLGFIEPTEQKAHSKKQAYRITLHGLDHLANQTN